MAPSKEAAGRRNIFNRCQKDPCWWIEKKLGQKIHPHQRPIIESVRDNLNTAVASCHAIGKTRTTAMIVLWWLCNHPNAIIITTAPTWRQVAQLLWAEIRDVIRAAPYELFPEECMPPADCRIKFHEKWYAIGMSSRQPEAIQGYHSDYVLIVVDEASGVPDTIFNAMLGNKASGVVRMLLISNPTRTDGQLFRAFHTARANWNALPVDAFDTPNFAGLKKEFDNPATTTARKLEMLRDAEKLVEAKAPGTYTYLVRPGWAAGIMEEYGEDSDSFRVRVRGQFPKGGKNQLIPLAHIMDAIARWHEAPKWWEDRQKWAQTVTGGLDVARLGDNNSVLSYQSDNILAPQTVYTPQYTTDLAGHVATRCGEIMSHQIVVDVVGVGGGPCDQLRTMVTGVIDFNGANSPQDPKKFYNMRAESYWKLRELFRLGLIAIPPSEALIGQLSSIRYKYHASGRILIESKDEMLARGVASPDEADSCMMAFSPQASLPMMQIGGETTNWSSGMYGRT